METAQVPTGVMIKLRDATAAQHKRAETRPLERDLACGRLPHEIFVAWLGQRLRMHEALEAAVGRLAAVDRRVADIVRPELLQSDNLRRDLLSFGIAPEEITCVEPVSTFVAEIRATAARDPLALLGSYYVFEGSKNGAKYIARAAARAYGLRPGPGLLYLDPHGDQQRPVWQAFKERMDAAGFSDVEQEAMVALAQRTFDLISAVDDELYRSVAVPA